MTGAAEEKVRKGEVQVTASPQAEHRCAYCHAEVCQREEWTCPSCELYVHHACLEELGPFCPSLGCETPSSDYRWSVALQSERAEVASSDPGSTWKLLALCAGGGAVLGPCLAYVSSSGTPGILTFPRLITWAVGGALVVPGFLLGVLALVWLQGFAKANRVAAASIALGLSLLTWLLAGSPSAGAAIGGLTLVALFGKRGRA